MGVLLWKLATTALRTSAARSGSEGIRHFKIRFWNFFNCAQFANTQILRRLKKYDNLANFDWETEKVWKSGKFWLEDRKSMKIWQIVTTRLKKVWKSGRWCSRRFYQIFILFLSCVWGIFHIYQNFILFLGGGGVGVLGRMGGGGVSESVAGPTF